MLYLAGLYSRFTAFRKDQQGAAAIEFAILFFFMVPVLLIGSVQATDALSVKQKASQTATVLADLTTQDTTISDSTWEGIQDTASRVMFPYQNSPIRMQIIGINVDADSKVTLHWDSNQWPHDGPLPTIALDTSSLPEGLIIPNSFYVVAVSEVDYQPILGGEYFGAMTFRDTAILSPRLSATIEYVDD